MRKPRFLLLDRDGVLNRDREDYVKSLEELEVFPWVPGAVARACLAGYRIAVVSNQQGVAKGLLTEDTLFELEEEISRRIREAGGQIEAFRYCVHSEEEQCDCRKPKPGMILDLQRTYGFDLAETYFVGDRVKDALAAKAAGCRFILVLSGHLTRENLHTLPVSPDHVCADLAEAVDWLLSM